MGKLSHGARILGIFYQVPPSLFLRFLTLWMLQAPSLLRKGKGQRSDLSFATVARVAKWDTQACDFDLGPTVLGALEQHGCLLSCEPGTRCLDAGSNLLCCGPGTLCIFLGAQCEVEAAILASQVPGRTK